MGAGKRVRQVVSPRSKRRQFEQTQENLLTEDMEANSWIWLESVPTAGLGKHQQRFCRRKPEIIPDHEITAPHRERHTELTYEYKSGRLKKQTYIYIYIYIYKHNIYI